MIDKSEENIVLKLRNEYLNSKLVKLELKYQNLKIEYKRNYGVLMVSIILNILYTILDLFH